MWFPAPRSDGIRPSNTTHEHYEWLLGCPEMDSPALHCCSWTYSLESSDCPPKDQALLLHYINFCKITEISVNLQKFENACWKPIFTCPYMYRLRINYISRLSGILEALTMPWSCIIWTISLCYGSRTGVINNSSRVLSGLLNQLCGLCSVRISWNKVIKYKS